jgi:hypothetical protein
MFDVVCSVRMCLSRVESVMCQERSHRYVGR